MAYSIDLRKRVVEAINNGMHTDDASKIFNVCVKSIYNWMNLYKKTGKLSPRADFHKGHSHAIVDWEMFKNFVQANKYCSSLQMTIKWKEITNKTIDRSTMTRALAKAGFTYKKKPLTMWKQTKKNEKSF